MGRFEAALWETLVPEVCYWFWGIPWKRSAPLSDAATPGGTVVWMVKSVHRLSRHEVCEKLRVRSGTV